MRYKCNCFQPEYIKNFLKSFPRIKDDKLQEGKYN